MAGSMFEAMKKAGLLHNESEEEKRHKQWKEKSFKNRFGDIASFEIWAASSGLPGDYWDRCGLCGKTYFDEKVSWMGPDGTKYAICAMCYVDGRANNKRLFPDLEGQ